MTEKLQKIIASRGLASRRKAEQMIEDGLVSVNGQAAKLGDRADPDLDVITVEGKVLPPIQKYLYLMLNKPRGYVTTMSDEKGRPCVNDLVKECGSRVYPIGRLDMDSEGLLLFTNDGDFANRVMHPKHEIKKLYEVTVKGFSESAFQKLALPIELDRYLIRKPLLKLISAKADKAVFHITIHEGRNRQIRRMCEHAGMSVIRLKRMSEGDLQLGDLPLGKWRYLSEAEIEKIQNG